MVDGVTMDGIAKRAGINKERLYNYFGDKQRLFVVVLCEELGRVAAAVPAESFHEEEVGDYEGRVFDYRADNPHLVRLLHWEALAYGERELPDEKRRTAHYRQKVNAFAAAQGAGIVADQPDAAHLFCLVLALADCWFAVPQLARMLTGSKGHGRAEHARRRAVVVEATRRLTGTVAAARPNEGTS